MIISYPFIIYYWNITRENAELDILLTCSVDCLFAQSSHKQETRLVAPKCFIQMVEKQNESFQSHMQQFSGHDSLDVINLDDDAVEGEDVQESTSQWQWKEDKLLINAWLNVSKDPVVGTDQKADGYWNRIHRYCEECNPGFIKRGPSAMKKRWHRINQAAQQFGGCYDQAYRKMGSGPNIESAMGLAHQLFLAKYKRKCNFERHWSELRAEEKWRTPKTYNGGSKRTKISACGAYSSSANPEMPAAEDAIVESHVCPKGTKVAKSMFDKGKSKASDIEHIVKEEPDAIRSCTAEKLYLSEELKIKRREMDLKEMELEMQLITADTSSMNEMQRQIHAKMLEKIKAKYN